MTTTATETTFGIGAIEGNVYANKFFGIEFALPEGFSFYSANQLADMNAATANANNNQAVVEAHEGGSAFFDMGATSENDPNGSIVMHITGPDAAAPDEAGYFAAAKDKIINQLKDAGVTVKSSETGTYTNRKTGDEFTAMKLAIELQGVSMYEEVICIKADDYYMTATATATDEDGLDSVLSHLIRIFG